MPHVSMTIGGRVYRLACEEGQESHLENLAASVDRKINELHGQFGEIGDMRLAVMAALMISDELYESQKAVDRLKAEVSQANQALAQHVAHHNKSMEAAAKVLDASSDRLEKLTVRVSGTIAAE